MPRARDVDPGSGSLTTQIPQGRAAWDAWERQRHRAAVATCSLVLRGRTVALMTPDELAEAITERDELLSALGLDFESTAAFMSRWDERPTGT